MFLDISRCFLLLQQQQYPVIEEWGNRPGNTVPYVSRPSESADGNQETRRPRPKFVEKSLNETVYRTICTTRWRPPPRPHVTSYYGRTYCEYFVCNEELHHLRKMRVIALDCWPGTGSSFQQYCMSTFIHVADILISVHTWLMSCLYCNWFLTHKISIWY